jgi:hypothetical protein
MPAPSRSYREPGNSTARRTKKCRPNGVPMIVRAAWSQPSAGLGLSVHPSQREVGATIAVAEPSSSRASCALGVAGAGLNGGEGGHGSHCGGGWGVAADRIYLRLRLSGVDLTLAPCEGHTTSLRTHGGGRRTTRRHERRAITLQSGDSTRAPNDGKDVRPVD